jgi:hypothetical protein
LETPNNYTMEAPIELGFKRRAIQYAAIRPGQRKMRSIFERAMLLALLSLVALIGAKGLGTGLATLFASIAAAL